ncbi:Serine hydrolase-like protein 2, partial [Harpegnathos saltator]
YTELKLIVPWGHIAAKAYGSSTGKFVLMVHGLMDNLGTFTRLVKYLPMEYYYVCIDLPGHGHSSYFPSWIVIDIINYVHVIHYVLEALQWKTCIYIGHSIGALIGIFFSVSQPHRIEKLIALDGIIPVTANTETMFIRVFKELYTLTIEAENNVKSYLYTKEEVLHALKNKRSAALNSDAAEAIFKRAVTETNGRYKFVRDNRLKRKRLSSLSLQGLIYIVRNLSVPLYLFIASHGLEIQFNEVAKVIESINPTSLSQLICIKGNHDFHNNHPERIAPFICEILHNNSSK